MREQNEPGSGAMSIAARNGCRLTEFLPISGKLRCMLLIILALSIFLAAGLAIRLSHTNHLVRVAQERFEAAQAADTQMTRALQLLSHELHALALGLRGNVDRLAREGSPSAGPLAALVAQLDHVAGEMAGQLMTEDQPRHLSCELVSLDALVAESVLALQASIAPGRRHVRVAGPEGESATIWADPRALRLVLARVLGEAVRSSAQDDWIEIGWSADESGLVLHVADEGTGAVWPSAAAAPRDSRGIGLRLSLARALVEAHGGTLQVEARIQVGTRVVITLPPISLRQTAPNGIGFGGERAHIAAA